VNSFAPVAVPFLIALGITRACGQSVIDYLRSKKSVQPISPDAPEKHRLKHGTPTMGGLLLLAAVLIAVPVSLVTLPPTDVVSARPVLLAVLGVFAFASLIGLLDDLGKARKKENKAGLSERAKLALQLVVSLGFVGALYATAQPGVTTVLGFGASTVDLGLAYYALAFLFITGFANAANFTDGLDGLAAGTTLIATLALAATAGAVTSEIKLFYGAVAGACAGFLYFNAYPARVFMGDTGSLALGMGLAAAALAAKQEILLLVVGLVYLAEIASMMIQRYVFKYRRIRFGIEYARANRVFRRAPLHHHFEELGWHETQVVFRFYVAALAAAMLGLLLAPYLMPAVTARTAP
jgi:phospho-N-acetylmuramoyl-pentapeptide-transferase